MYSVIQTVLFNLGFSIASERFTGWYRYQRTTPLRLWMMFGARLPANLPVALLAPALPLLIGAWTGGVYLPASAWASLVVRVLFGALHWGCLSATWRLAPVQRPRFST